MSAVSKNELKYDNSVSFPNNNNGAITPSNLREFNVDLIDSTVNQTIYTENSASFTSRIIDTNTIVNTLISTASVNGDVLTFTKQNGSSFDLVVTASLVELPWNDVTNKPPGLVSGSSQVISILNSLNAFSSSQLTKDSTLATYTGSVDTKFTTIGSQSGSWLNTSLNSYTASNDIKFSTIGSQSGSWDNTLLNSFTSSQEAKNITLGSVTASLQGQLTNIGSQSGSWVTESETGSFARVNVSNTFTTTQNITGDLNVSGVITANTIHTIIESSSVIYSSGSNQFGDAVNDRQTLYGSTNVVNQFTASGLNYPSADNGVKSFIQTDGAGNLSLQYVDTIWENVRAGQSVPKGTPLYISGSQGANPIVYAADASNPAKMPVTFIAGDAYTAGTTYPANVLGLIEGLDLTGYTAGQTVYVAEGGGWSTSLPSGSSSITQVLGVVTKGGNGGKGLVLNPGPAQLPGLQLGNIWVGGSNNQPTTITSASLATTGSNIFNGNQTITGSLSVNGSSTITGSVRGNVITQGIASNTASLDFGTANFFELNLVSGSNTRVEATNVRPGQTVSLKVTQASVVGGTISFSSQFDFPSISPYSATQSGSAVDVLTFVTFNNTGSIYSAGVNNLR